MLVGGQELVDPLSEITKICHANNGRLNLSAVERGRMIQPATQYPITKLIAIGTPSLKANWLSWKGNFTVMIFFLASVEVLLYKC